MATYIFSGKVFPERADVSLPKHNLKMQVPPINGWIEVSISLLHSQISVIAKTEEETQDLWTLRSYIADIVGLYLDTYGYLSGRGYDFEITSVTTETNDKHIVFGVGVSELEAKTDERPKSFAEVLNLFKGDVEFEQQLRLALLNFRLAIRHPTDLGFYSYRCLEAMTHPFGNEWPKFYEELGITDSQWIRELKEAHADAQRHGRSTFMTSIEAVTLLGNTQKVIDRFIEYIGHQKAKA